MFSVLIAFLIAAWAPGTLITPQEKPQEQKSPTAVPTQNQNVSAPANPSPAQENEQKRSAWGKYKEQTKQKWLDFVNWSARNDKAVVALSTLAVAAFTFALVVATAFLWLSGVYQSRRELRAYVSVRPGPVFSFPRPQPPFPFVIVRCIYFNHGQTPAFRVRTVYDMGVFPRATRTPPRKPRRRIIDEAAIFPQANVDMELYFNVALTPGEITDVSNGLSRIFVWGTTHCRDTFKKRRRTTFFASAGGPSFLAAVTASPQRPFAWSYGHQHNQAT